MSRPRVSNPTVTTEDWYRRYPQGRPTTPRVVRDSSHADYDARRRSIGTRTPVRRDSTAAHNPNRGSTMRSTPIPSPQRMRYADPEPPLVTTPLRALNRRISFGTNPLLPYSSSSSSSASSNHGGWSEPSSSSYTSSPTDTVALTYAPYPFNDPPRWFLIFHYPFLMLWQLMPYFGDQFFNAMHQVFGPFLYFALWVLNTVVYFALLLLKLFVWEVVLGVPRKIVVFVAHTGLTVLQVLVFGLIMLWAFGWFLKGGAVRTPPAVIYW